MGAVDTTYTFTATDTITSTKMNNIIDQTTITTDAIIGNTLEVASGKLKVRAQGITSNEIAAGSVTSNAIADGTIVNSDISPTAAIAGTKIAAQFGNQSINATGGLGLSGSSSSYTAATLTNTSGVQTQLFSNANLIGGILTITNHPMLLATNNTERMRITAAGNVGIGTSSPSAPLEVKGGSSINADPEIRVSGSSGHIDIHNSLSGGSYNGIVSSGDKAFIFSDGTQGTGNLVIAPWAANASGIRINSSGNVGICKSSPTTALDVNGTVTATAFAGPLTGNVTGIASGNIKQGGGSNQLSNVVYMGWSGSNQLRVQVDSTDFGANWPINITGKASTLSNGGGTGNAMTFNWSGQGGQPTWLWGGNDGTNHYVYNPSNFSVNYANSAGSASTATTATTVSNGAITAAKLNGEQSGDPPIFGVRAWANIDGTVGSVSIRQGGNVSGVVRNQLGRYTITFTTPMPDTNYAIVAWARDANATDNNYFVSAASNATKLAGSFQIEVNSPGGTVDSPEINIMVIR